MWEKVYCTKCKTYVTKQYCPREGFYYGCQCKEEYWNIAYEKAPWKIPLKYRILLRIMEWVGNQLDK